jgi:hypothetical protein
MLAVELVPSGAFARGDKPRRDHEIRIDREIAEAIDEVDSERIQDSIERLEDFGTRHACSAQVAPPGQGVTAARDWIFQQFSKIDGLQVRLDPFRHPRCPQADTFNVVAWQPGRRNPERLVVIGGHYDIAGTGRQRCRLADLPGAGSRPRARRARLRRHAGVRRLLGRGAGLGRLGLDCGQPG